ncbi:MAG TPA: sigma-54 dependent transcriptional regulator, partial [Acidobacteriota bacterium]|nr:sigma-54 dependent transcriptional regulator [Acidobacteriota bacterium]
MKLLVNTILDVTVNPADWTSRVEIPCCLGKDGEDFKDQSQSDSTHKKMKLMKRILIVDDDIEFRQVLEQLMLHEGHWVRVAESSAKAIQLFREMANTPQPFDLVISDMMLGDGSGLDVLSVVREVTTDMPFIFVTAFGSMESVAEAIRKDVFDYVAKPFDAGELLRVVRRALSKLSTEIEPTLEVPDSVAGSLKIIGSSPPMIELYKAVARVSATDSTVLMSGESGTGKELVARAIHNNSLRAHRPFIGVNCGAFPETLLESELFGHAKGSFTGANTERIGIFEAAAGGTVFLDEISETSPNFQVKLLRVLQERELDRVGGEQPVKIDVRVISATNKKLGDEVAAGRFREDLFYRLQVVPIVLPALRERLEDLPLLVQHFIATLGPRTNPKVRTIDEAALERLSAHHWPGNIRELGNVIEQ